MSRWCCTTCSKSFARKGDLTRHELLHTGIKPHVCDTCGKGFSQFSGLKTHWNVHTKAKPYLCGIGTCTKAFGDPSSRTRHRKETHRSEGTYKCIIPDCGTRIKRRSAFVAHLRKHGLDPKSLDLDAIILQSSGRGILSSPAHFATPDVENDCQHNLEFPNVIPSFYGDSAGGCVLDGGDDTNRAIESIGWPVSGNVADCRQATWFPRTFSDDLLLDQILDETVNGGLSNLPQDIYSYPHSNFEDPYCVDGVFSETVDYRFLAASSLSLPSFGPFLEAGSDGYESLLSSPSSTYSALCTSDFDDDVVSLSLANNASQESLFA